MEVEAFCSVHDMIHAAISAFGRRATLREIYRHCEVHGRIAYKRTQGWRFITDNQHWKSQIRHALYTSGRFARCMDDADYWAVASSHSHVQPQTTRLLLPTPASCNNNNNNNVPSGEASSSQGPTQAAAQQAAGAHSPGQGQSTNREQGSEAAAAAATAQGLGWPNVKGKRTTRPCRQLPARRRCPPARQWSSTDVADMVVAPAASDDACGSDAGSADEGTPGTAHVPRHLLASSNSDVEADEDDTTEEGGEREEGHEAAAGHRRASLLRQQGQGLLDTSASSISGTWTHCNALLQATSLAWHHQQQTTAGSTPGASSRAHVHYPLGAACCSQQQQQAGAEERHAVVNGPPAARLLHPVRPQQQPAVADLCGRAGKRAAQEAAPHSPPTKMIKVPSVMAPTTPSLRASWAAAANNRRSRRKATVVHRSAADSGLQTTAGVTPPPPPSATSPGTTLPATARIDAAAADDDDVDCVAPRSTDGNCYNCPSTWSAKVAFVQGRGSGWSPFPGGAAEKALAAAVAGQQAALQAGW